MSAPEAEPPILSPTFRFTTWTLLTVVATIIVGSIVGKLEIVSRGTGRLVVVSRTQSIQSQLRGKVHRILVQDGDRVHRGEPLVILDTTEVESDIARLQAEVARHSRDCRLTETVLFALTSLDPARPEFVDRGVAHLDAPSGNSETLADAALVRSTLSSLHWQTVKADMEIAQAETALSTGKQRMAQAETEARLVSDRDAAIQKLEQSGAISHTTFLDRSRERENASANALVARAQVDEARVALDSASQRRDEFIARSTADNRRSASEAQINLSIAKANLVVAQHHLRDATVTSPVDGLVADLKIYTTGGFVDAGQQLMSVVPAEQQLECEGLFENRDAGFLEAGQKVILKLDTFPSERFGYVTGRVITVSADARKSDDGQSWVYAARVALDQNRVEREGEAYPFAPGMTGTVDVVTGERRIIAYFFEPIVKAIQDGLTER